MSEKTYAAIVAALERVYDPCSLAVNANLNVLEMGLVRECTVDEKGVAHIKIGATNPFCTLIGSIMEAVEEQVAEVPDVSAVDLTLDTTTPWTPELMSDGARRKLDAQRRELRRSLTIVPRQWEQASAASAGHSPDAKSEGIPQHG